MSFNKVIVVGNLGRDPELRYTPQGTPCCTFSLASNERRRGRDGAEAQDVTTWFRVTVWGKQAETVSKYLTKGRSVYVEGRLHVSEWTDKEGKPRFTLEVNATDVQFIGGAQEGERLGLPASGGEYGRAAAATGRTGGARNAPAAAADESDDIPF
ncbi:MAG TPA: single-stranded DNA-binding protein [Pyrinomonadaceae bacterium]|jgi:single-strand DNA-binding protein